MRLAIFGDSFARQTIRHDLYEGWPRLLGKSLGITEVNFASPGTSTWWSYENFLKNYKNFDHIIFCHSNSQRYPCLPDDRKDENIRHGDILGHNGPYMKELSKFYLDIFPLHFLKFVCKYIAYEVDTLCKQHNKKVIQLFTEKDTPALEIDSTFHGSRIYDFYYPDIVETATINNKTYTMHQLLFSSNLNQNPHDKRVCHFNSINNKLVAEKIKEILIKNNGYRISFADYDWCTTDPIIDKIYQK